MIDADAVIFACGFVLVVYLRYRLTKSRPADDQAIDDLMKARRLQTVSVTRNDNYWRYWLRGRLFTLSNCARIYIAVGDDPEGSRREIHLTFDDWLTHKGEPQILMEREIPRGESKKPTAEAPPPGLWDPQLDSQLGRPEAYGATGKSDS
ncbi:hypothetical protein P12x_005714 [Tundrisphaera lichenicola]|uniref:hypothetical protein n=1 Tax=Tundrisphaera lichenicola TaxID=2029860 RepID=UPI003EBD4A9F